MPINDVFLTFTVVSYPEVLPVPSQGGLHLVLLCTRVCCTGVSRQIIITHLT